MQVPHPRLFARHPSAILLIVQLVGLLLYPVLESTRAGPIALGAFGITVLIFTTGMVRRTPGLTWLSVCLALPAFVLLLRESLCRARRHPRIWGT